MNGMCALIVGLLANRRLPGSRLHSRLLELIGLAVYYGIIQIFVFPFYFKSMAAASDDDDDDTKVSIVFFRHHLTLLEMIDIVTYLNR